MNDTRTLHGASRSPSGGRTEAWHIQPLSAFDSVAEEWRAINAAGSGTPLLDPDFVRPALDQFATGGEVLACFGPPGEARALGVFQRKNIGAWQTLQPNVAPLGLFVKMPDVALEPALRSLARHLPGMPMLVALTQQDPLFDSRPEPNGHLRTADYITTARIHVAGRFDDYWASRGKNLRHSIKRQRNKLARENVATRLEMVSAPGDMARCVADFGALEATGWKGRGQSAVEAENRLGRFYTAMMTTFCERGEGLVCRYYYDDRLVSNDLCVHRNGTLIILKTAYDEAEKATSPAHLMRNEAFRLFYDEMGFSAIEFYGRVMDWHARLTDDVRTMYHVNYYRWPLLTRLHRTGEAKLTGTS